MFLADNPGAGAAGVAHEFEDLSGDPWHSGVYLESVITNDCRSTIFVVEVVAYDACASVLRSLMPLHVGVKDVFCCHLAVALVELDAFLELPGPGQEVVGNAPGLGQHWASGEIFLSGNETLTN